MAQVNEFPAIIVRAGRTDETVAATVAARKDAASAERSRILPLVGPCDGTGYTHRSAHGHDDGSVACLDETSPALDYAYRVAAGLAKGERTMGHADVEDIAMAAIGALVEGDADAPGFAKGTIARTVRNWRSSLVAGYRADEREAGIADSLERLAALADMTADGFIAHPDVALVGPASPDLDSPVAPARSVTLPDGSVATLPTDWRCAADVSLVRLVRPDGVTLYGQDALSHGQAATLSARTGGANGDRAVQALDRDGLVIRTVGMPVADAIAWLAGRGVEVRDAAHYRVMKHRAMKRADMGRANG